MELFLIAAENSFKQPAVEIRLIIRDVNRKFSLQAQLEDTRIMNKRAV